MERARVAVVVAAVTSNLALAAAPGNVMCRRRETGLSKDSIVNVSSRLTVDRTLLTDRIGTLPQRLLQRVDAGLKIVLGL